MDFIKKIIGIIIKPFVENGSPGWVAISQGIACIVGIVANALPAFGTYMSEAASIGVGQLTFWMLLYVFVSKWFRADLFNKS